MYFHSLKDAFLINSVLRSPFTFGIRSHTPIRSDVLEKCLREGKGYR